MLLPIYQQTDLRIPRVEYIVSLLCKAPAPEGGDVQEPTWGNYGQQAVTFRRPCMAMVTARLSLR
jgi:hypothetical protein